MREYTGPTKAISQVAFVPSGPPLLAAVSLDCAYLWRLDHSEPAAVLPWKGEADGDPRLLVSPDGRWLVAGPLSRLYCWDLSAIPPGPSRPMPTADLVAAAFRGAADRLALVYKRLDDAKRNLWTGEVSLSVLDQFDPRRSTGLRLTTEVRTPLFGPFAARESWVASFAPNMSWLALSAHTMAVHLWETESFDPPRRISSLNGIPGDIAFSPDASRLAIDAGTTVYIHDVESLNLLTKWKTKHCYTPKLAWSPDGRLLARADSSTTVRVYDTQSGRQISSLGTKRGRHVCVAFAPDGLTYAAGTNDGPVRVWDLE